MFSGEAIWAAALEGRLVSRTGLKAFDPIGHMRIRNEPKARGSELTHEARLNVGRGKLLSKQVRPVGQVVVYVAEVKREFVIKPGHEWRPHFAKATYDNTQK